MRITSAQNPRIKAAAALQHRRDRQREGLVPVEGYEELCLALESGVQPQALFFCPELFADPRQEALLKTLHSTTAAIEVSPDVFEKIAYRENPDGWLATCPAPQRDLGSLKVSDNPLLVLVEGVEKPGNLGAILRTADAAGVEAVIACDPGTDWGNPNTIRASKGAVFSVPVSQSSAAEILAWLRQKPIQIVAASPQASQLYTQIDLSGPVVLALGEEKHGLSREWLDQADRIVKIPMFGRVNSLNVAASAALLIYEAVRQRQ